MRETRNLNTTPPHTHTHLQEVQKPKKEKKKKVVCGKKNNKSLVACHYSMIGKKRSPKSQKNDLSLFPERPCLYTISYIYIQTNDHDIIRIHVSELLNYCACLLPLLFWNNTDYDHDFFSIPRNTPFEFLGNLLPGIVLYCVYFSIDYPIFNIVGIVLCKLRFS